MMCAAFAIRVVVTGIIAVSAAEVTGQAMCSIRSATQRLIEELNDVDSNIRLSAAGKLGRERDPAALGALCRALTEDRSYGVRKWAAMALANFRDGKSLDALESALRDMVPVREAAISSISSIGGRKAVSIFLQELQSNLLSASEKLWILGGLRASAEHVDPRRLLPLLQDADDWVATEAATTIAWIGDESVARDALERIRNRGECLKPATVYFRYVFGEKAGWQELVGHLRTGEELQRRHAALLLALIPGDEPLSALVDQLKTEKRLLVKQAIEDALARRGREGILEMLSRLDDGALGDPLRIVSSLVGAAALDSLASALRDPEENTERRQLLKDCIVSAAEPEGVGRLLKLLKDPKPSVRKAAARALGVVREIKAVRPLCQLLSDGDPDVRREAIISLGLIGDPSCVPSLLEHPARESEGGDVIEAEPPAGEVILIVGEELYQSEAEAVIVALGRIGDRRAVPYLLDALAGAERTSSRASAARALGLIKEPQAVEPLLATLKEEIDDGDRTLACNCVEALGSIGCRRAAPVLISISQCHDRYVRCDVADALGRIGGPGVLVALLPLLWDENPFVRRRAAIALARLGDPRAIAPLVAQLVHSAREEDLQMVDRVVDALAAVGEPAVGLLADELSNPNENARLCAVSALASIGGTKWREAVSQLLKSETSQRVREAAREALRATSECDEFNNREGERHGLFGPAAGSH